MHKPESFHQPYVVLRNVPYLCVDGPAGEGPHTGGVLRRGETVWTKERYDWKRCPRSAAAFVDGVGVVSLDPRCLVKTGVLDPQRPHAAPRSGARR